MELMATRDDVTVRIDTELRAKARELEINMSRLFEGALRDEVFRLETRAELIAAKGSEQIKLDLEDDEDRPYVGTFTGKLLGENDDVSVYLADDNRLIVYDANRRDWHVLGERNDDLTDWFPHDPGVVAEVLHALGETPEIEI
jgi:Post-segregation antitoxin CcdA